MALSRVGRVGLGLPYRLSDTKVPYTRINNINLLPSLYTNTQTFYSPTVAVGSAFTNTRSLSFNGSTQWLSRTMGSGWTGTTKCTWSFWINTPLAGGNYYMFSWAGNGDTNGDDGSVRCRCSVNAGGTVSIIQEGSPGTWAVDFTWGVQANTWTHIVIAVDTTQASTGDRIKFYFNGVDRSGSNSGTFPAQNAALCFTDGTTSKQWIGRLTSGSPNPYNGLIDDFTFIDGLALTPSSFATSNAPIDTSGLTFGTKGFTLKFEDPTSTSTLSADTSGNGNNWTTTAMTTSNSSTSHPT